VKIYIAHLQKISNALKQLKNPTTFPFINSFLIMFDWFQIKLNSN